MPAQSKQIIINKPTLLELIKIKMKFSLFLFSHFLNGNRRKTKKKQEVC